MLTNSTRIVTYYCKRLRWVVNALDMKELLCLEQSFNLTNPSYVHGRDPRFPVLLYALRKVPTGPVEVRQAPCRYYGSVIAQIGRSQEVKCKKYSPRASLKCHLQVSMSP